MYNSRERFRVVAFVVLLLQGTLAFAQSQNVPSDSIVEKVKRVDYATQSKNYVIGNLKAEGLLALNPDLLISTTGLVKGDSIPVPSDRISSVTRRLMDQRHFSDVRAETTFRGDTVDITFVFEERLRVRQWRFHGTKGSEAKDIQKKLKLRRSGELSDNVLMNAMKGIKDFYDEKGFRLAKIDIEVTPDSTVKNFVNVDFKIERGKKVRIKEIEIEGNDSIIDRKIRKAMKSTKKLGINIFADTKYNPDNFEEDKFNIISYYKSKGYRDARIVADSTFEIKEGRIGIWFKVEEGEKYYYGDIDWYGNSKMPTPYLNQIVGLKRGDTYDSEAMGRRVGSIMGEMGELSVASLYRDDGYLAFAIEPIERVQGDTVDVEIRMIEGKQFTINEVNFDGNTRTNDRVVRRELDTRPGELYSHSLLIRSYQRLATMGQFDAQSFATPDIQPNFQNNTVDISYSLQEVSKDQFELSGGWGSGMFIASVGVNFTNVSIRKLFQKDAWKPYPSGDNQVLSLKFQSNGTYYTAGSFSFTEPWLGGKKATSLTFSAYISEQTDAYYWGTTPTCSFQTVGVSVGLGKRLEWPDPYFQLSVGLSYQLYTLDNWSYFLVSDGTCNIFAVDINFGRSSIDDPVGYATRGSEFMISTSITPPWSLFDGKDYTDPDMTDEEKYQWVEYYKINLSARWFMPLTPDNKLVLMTRAQFGYLGAYNSNKISPFEGFEVGGDGLTTYSVYGVETIGLRGYSNGSLTPYGDYGLYSNVYTKLTAELRYPIVREGSTLVYGLAFAEAGNAYVDVSEFNPFNLKRSLGVGLRVYLPVLGMLGVDWAYGFDPDSTDPTTASGSNFHFTMGMSM